MYNNMDLSLVHKKIIGRIKRIKFFSEDGVGNGFSFSRSQENA